MTYSNVLALNVTIVLQNSSLQITQKHFIRNLMFYCFCMKICFEKFEGAGNSLLVFLNLPLKYIDKQGIFCSDFKVFHMEICTYINLRPNKVLLVLNLGFCTFAWNLVFRQIWGCWFQIFQKFFNLKKAVLVPNWNFLHSAWNFPFWGRWWQIQQYLFQFINSIDGVFINYFSICSAKYLNKAFLVLSLKFFMQDQKFIFKQFSGTDFKFHSHSYSSRNIQLRFAGPNDKVTSFCWRYFTFINLELMISNLSITFWNYYSVTPTLSRFYPQDYILVETGTMISGFTKNYNFNRALLWGK